MDNAGNGNAGRRTRGGTQVPDSGKLGRVGRAIEKIGWSFFSVVCWMLVALFVAATLALLLRR
jgi:hypothetical protein